MTFPVLLGPGRALLRRWPMRGRLALLALATLAVACCSLWLGTELAGTDGARQQAALALAVAAALLGYLLIAFGQVLADGMQRLQSAVDAIAAGDLAHVVPVDGCDEVAALARRVESMAQSLSGTVAEIRSFSTRVRQAGGDVAGSSRLLSERAHEQAFTLRQAVATVGQLSASVAGHADHAKRLGHQAEALRQDAQAGGQAMAHSVQAMAALDASSRRVGEIIGVIDGIAYQTGILALNAAVEAARAGESGRGFAVVAAEVRRLAQRSSQAAAEIRNLVEQAIGQTASSGQRIDAASRTLQAVVDGVIDMSARLQDVVRDSAAQDRGLREMAASVEQLDAITRRNAGVVQASAQAADQLVERAHALDAAVGSMRLRQGTAEEAQALVRQALEVVRREGLTAAAQRLRDPAGGFIDRDLYIFVVDRGGHYLVHGARPAFEGRRVHDVPGVDGDRFVADAFAAVATGEGGWIDYEILNIETGRVQPKGSFVVPIDADQVLGCGVYRSLAR